MKKQFKKAAYRRHSFGHHALHCLKFAAIGYYKRRLRRQGRVHNLRLYNARSCCRFVFQKKTHPLIWLCAVVSAVGLYFLSVDPARGAFNIELSDLAYLGCAVFFAVQIILVSIYSPQVNCIALSCIQFAVAAVFSGIGMLFFETPSFAAILNAAGPLLYAGILSCGIAYTLQVIGQRGIDPAIASLIMCLESVFSVIAGFLLLNQRMTPREILGCGIMFAATVAAQLIPSTQKKNSRN